jgi:hypothetical protein
VATSRIKIVIVIAVFILGVVGLLLLLRAPTVNPEDRRLAQCLSHERQIGLAIAMFASENNGRLPETLEDLVPYHSSNRIFFCPSATDQTRYSYVLTGATNVWRANTNTIILVEFAPNHSGRRHVLFDDGRVELKADSDL